MIHELNQRPLFDRSAGNELKEAGLSQASVYRQHVLSVAKEIAVEIGKRKRTLTADDVQRELIQRGFTPDSLGNAAGSMFRGRAFRFTGRWEVSERVSNHGRPNRVWEYIGK